MTTITMPQLGETIVEGTILKWLKQEGERIERDEPLFEISTDKVDTEVPSPVSGTVSKVLVAEGETVPVNTPLMEIADEGAAPSTDPPAPADRGTETGAEETEPAAEPSPPQPAGSPAPGGAPAPAATSVATVPPLPDRGPRSQILSPLVRRLAAEHDLDLSSIAGSGTGGRITKQDVLEAIAGGGAPAAAAASAATPAAAPATAQPAIRPAPTPAVAGAGEEVVPMSHIRKAIAEHMHMSVQVSARAWNMVEANVEHIVQVRERAKDAFQAREGIKLTVTPFFCRAICDALLAFPMVNSELRGEDIVLKRYVNLGIAVSYDEGLIVPVVKGADTLNIVGLARAIDDLAARARSHQLKPDEVTGGTFTLTNPGPYGSILSVPIIAQPQTGILAVDAIERRPVVIADAIAIRHMVYISMSWDHRVIDGALASQFLARVKQNLETWDFAEDLGV
jgi:pyruvate dehydrogenase E2 component (dihydrolipoamide acetyltransferase)